jgi:L-glyceraldehyde 3-phosphate reductase
VLIGASSVKQLEDNVAMLHKLSFSGDELQMIEEILKDD